MARPQSEDFLHNMRFQVSLADGGNQTRRFGAAAGFTTVSIPAIQVETASYREGTFIYTRKYPGIASVEDISMSRGVVLNDTPFWTWLQQDIVEGAGNYREDLVVQHYHRAAQAGTKLNTDSPFFKKLTIHEAFPSSVKPTSDLDSSSSEVGMTEVTITFEYYEVENPASQVPNT